MEYRVLGSLEVLDDSGHRLSLGGSRQQTVLGSLLLRAGSTVPLDRLVDELWETPPDTAEKTVQVYVSRLRRLLSPGTIESRSGGYALLLDGDHLDLTQFERLADEGREALGSADCERAATLLREALALWRGPALAGLSADALRREAERLEEARLQAVEDRIEADLGSGRERDVVAELRALAAEHPFRERLRAQLMRALFATGRQSEALEVYRETRTLLDEELGIEPGAELRDLERRMLSHDPQLEPAREKTEPVAPAAGPAVSPAEVVRGRRPATVVFADVVDSTALGEQLDPESVHRILERYSEIARETLERHGGEIEKFIGDAVVAFFGLTELHEDDALRAVRAAVELRQAVMALRDELMEASGVDLGIRIGVNSGDVFVGGGAGRETFATGDSVNVAARLEQGAEAWEILLGDRTFRLVSDEISAEPLEPLEVRGRSAPVQAWRLLDLVEMDPVPERVTTPFVGRGREQEALRRAFDLSREQQTCRLCTILGPAGIGKTRIARELVAEAREAATVAVGRCLSYGEAITYHPLIEIVRQLAGEDPDEGVARLMGPGEESELVARRIRGLVGRSDETAPVEETFWAVRKLLEATASERPLIVGFEDVHWAEPLLLDLIEYLVGFSDGRPIFVVCLARPDLLETRPAWAVEDGNKSVVRLDPLAEADARALVESVSDGELRDVAKIVRTAEGNPLFLEQLVATDEELGESAALPPSIQAVLAARIAALDHGERTVLERAAVEGRNFRWSSVSALLSDAERHALGERLMALVRRQLIQPNPSASSAEDAFRFTHVLIQEAAYDGLPKEVRAELHERLARRLASSSESGDEIVGFHLEQSYRSRAELGLVAERERQVAAEASAHLETAGHKAFVLGDPAGCADLLDRAASLLPPDDPTRLALLPTLGSALFEAGRLADAYAVLGDALERSAGDELLHSRACVERQFVELQTASGDCLVTEAERVAEVALRVFERYEDELGQCRAWSLRAMTAWLQCRAADADEAWRQGAEHARDAGDERELFTILAWRASAAVFGPAPAAEAIALCSEIREQVQTSPLAVAQVLPPLAGLHAMQGDFETARSLVAEANVILGELGRIYTVGLAHSVASVELLAGNPAAAEERLRQAYELLDEMGEKALLSTTAAMLAESLYAQDLLGESARFCEASREAAATDDLSAQVEWRCVEAKLLARRGRNAEAESLAREAVDLASKTDFLEHHGKALLDLGDVLRMGGELDAAKAAVRAGLEVFEEKGDDVMAGRARALLAGTGPA